MTSDDDRTIAAFIMVPCVCGRTLRARWEQVGTEIRCWDCQQEVTVRAPHARRRLLGRLAGSVTQIFGGQGTDALGRAAAALAMSLAVPYVGLVLAAVLLAAMAAAYDDLVRSAAEPTRPFGVDWRQVRARLSPLRGFAYALFAVGTVLPLWALGAGVHQPPRLSATALAALALCWAGLPLAVAAGQGVRTRDGLALLARHPVATLASLAIVPVLMVGLEATIVGLIYTTRSLPIFMADFIPMPGRLVVSHGFAYQGLRLYTTFPMSYFVEGYFAGLRRGYCLIGTVPPSLSLPTRLGIDPTTFTWPVAYYGFFRFLLTLAVSLTLIVGFAVQAQCLGVLLHARKLRLA